MAFHAHSPRDVEGGGVRLGERRRKPTRRHWSRTHVLCGVAIAGGSVWLVGTAWVLLSSSSSSDSPTLRKRFEMASKRHIRPPSLRPDSVQRPSAASHDARPAAFSALAGSKLLLEKMGGGADVVRRMMRGQAHVKKMAAFLPYTRYGADGDPDALAPNEAGVRCARLNDTADDGGYGASPPLRVFMQEHPNWSWGRRVCGSLRSFAPAGRVCWTDSRSDADVEIVHVDGDNELWYAETVAALRAPPFVVLQHGLTQQNFWQPRPSRQAYAAVWSRALLVVSFQDLAADAADGERGFDFYPMPWGANEDVFAPGPNPTPADERAKTVLIFGNLGETPGDDESNGSVLGAAAHAGLRVRHVGDPGDSLCHPCPGGVPAAGETDTGRLLCQPMASLGGKAPCFWHDNLGRISDAEMVAEMRSARFAAVLRKHEGFEMPGIESLFCGARAIVYDLPSYRWYEGHASFLNASLAGEEHAAELRAMLERPPRPVAETELAELRRAFAWQSIVPQLFERIRTQLAAKVPISSVRGVPVPLG